MCSLATECVLLCVLNVFSPRMARFHASRDRQCVACVCVCVCVFVMYMYILSRRHLTDTHTHTRTHAHTHTHTHTHTTITDLEARASQYCPQNHAACASLCPSSPPPKQFHAHALSHTLLRKPHPLKPPPPPPPPPLPCP
jgi:hypothetical protein